MGERCLEGFLRSELVEGIVGECEVAENVQGVGVVVEPVMELEELGRRWRDR